MHGGLKTNQQLLQDVVAGAADLNGVSVAVCVPFPYLAQAQSALAGTVVAWGAQTLSEHAQGAFTGEVSASMLQDFACRYVLVGHSERRSIYGESDTVIAEKFAAALAAGLRPVPIAQTGSYATTALANAATPTRFRTASICAETTSTV